VGLYIYNSAITVNDDIVYDATSIDNQNSTSAKIDNLTAFDSVKEKPVEAEIESIQLDDKQDVILKSSSQAQNVTAGSDHKVKPDNKTIISALRIKPDFTFDLPSSTSVAISSLAIAKKDLSAVLEKNNTVQDEVRNEPILSPFSAQDFLIEISERPLLLTSIFVKERDVPVRRNTISLFTGVSKWGFHLNNNYLTALDPADFTFEEGNGKTMAFSYEYDVKNKISLFGSVSWDRVISYSGHNSNVNYELQNESGDLSNTLDLTMASPFGLVQSDVVVSRNSAVSADQTSLVLDLHNRHQFDNIGLSTGLAFMLIENTGFEFSSHLGIGLNYLVGLENELESFDLSSSDFSSGQTSITQNQQAVNKLSTQFNLGVNLRRSLGENTLVGVSVDYVRGLSDVYAEDDFSSRLSARRYNLSLSRRF